MITTFTGGIAATNSHLLECPTGILLIDAAEGVTHWLRKLNRRPQALFLTHQHFDHVLDAAAVSAEFGCPIYAWAPYSQDLTLEALLNRHTGAGLSVPRYQVTHVLGDSASVHLAGMDWSLLHIPGHSPDSICIYDPAQKLVFGGDVLFAGGIGRSDFPGGSHQMLVSGIKSKLLPLPDDTEVYPGHGPSTTVGDERADNPYLAD